MQQSISSEERRLQQSPEHSADDLRRMDEATLVDLVQQLESEEADLVTKLLRAQKSIEALSTTRREIRQHRRKVEGILSKKKELREKRQLNRKTNSAPKRKTSLPNMEYINPVESLQISDELKRIVGRKGLGFRTIDTFSEYTRESVRMNLSDVTGASTAAVAAWMEELEKELATKNVYFKEE